MDNNLNSENPAVTFNPNDFLIVPARSFEDLKTGEIFRDPSRTLTNAHSAAFQNVSCNNHPVHYDNVQARKHGHKTPVVHSLQVQAFTAPGASMFPQVIGEVFIAFTELSCKFLKEVNADDTLNSELEIISPTSQGGGKAVVETAARIHNQNGELGLSDTHKYLLKTKHSS
ncbi:MaoC family dehydratase [Pedobacter hartonius]|uniref:Acyl dehydratase n=1 Tax=Pedobacter hartonius TaxID=425514 RepID=A0A1H4GB08_9SPHI|nr:MaoC/PaaZ C-terminal domain-containing protein [Pedobacter hartonius]SEB06627.1 Acyl dehydratase [Pedobacter hartonius]